MNKKKTYYPNPLSHDPCHRLILNISHWFACHLTAYHRTHSNSRSVCFLFHQSDHSYHRLFSTLFDFSLVFLILFCNIINFLKPWLLICSLLSRFLSHLLFLLPFFFFLLLPSSVYVLLSSISFLRLRPPAPRTTVFMVKFDHETLDLVVSWSNLAF